MSPRPLRATRVSVLGPESAPEGQVAFGTWVEVEDESGARFSWWIVGPEETDPRRGWLSALSPVGRALLGRAAGESVEVRTPQGVAEDTVLEVRRVPPGTQ